MALLFGLLFFFSFFLFVGTDERTAHFAGTNWKGPVARQLGVNKRLEGASGRESSSSQKLEQAGRQAFTLVAAAR